MIFSMLSPLSALANEETNSFKQPNFDESTMLAKAAIAEQLRVHGSPGVLHKDLQDLSGNEDVAVIVHLSEKPVALEQGITELQGRSFNNSHRANAKAKVRAQQADVVQKMRGKNVSFSQGYTFDTVLNGFAATVKADDLDKLVEIPGVH